MILSHRIAGRAHAAVALETTLLVHGVPTDAAMPLAARLADDVRDGGGVPAVIGVLNGLPTVGLSDAQLRGLVERARTPKLNTANLGAALHRGDNGATTVSATMEIAAAAGVRVFATGGIGGVHRGYGRHLDVSADLVALARFPVAVVASGVKGILDVAATREALETLGVPVVGFGTDAFPAFYVRDGGVGVDARFDDAADLACFVDAETARTGRGVLVCQPAPEAHAMSAADFEDALTRAQHDAPDDGNAGSEPDAGARPRALPGPRGRDATPELLGALHRVTGGRTLEANIALASENARLAGRVASEIGRLAGA